MAFNIIKGEDIAIEGLIIMLYGDPSTGKTSTAFTAEKPILFDFDGGAHRSYIKTGKHIVRISEWEEMVSKYPNLAAELKDYQTIIIDTVETCLDYIRIHVENKDYKLKKNKLQMYGALKDEFYSFLSRITKLGKNIVLIAHATTEEQNGITKTTPKITGGSKDLVRQKADFIGYLYIQNNARVLNFSPTDYHEGKNSAGFPVLELPDYTTEENYFKDKVDEMRKSLTIISKKQEESVVRMKEMFGKLDKIGGVDELNSFFISNLKDNKELSNSEKKQAWSKTKDKATELGCKFDSDKNHFYIEQPVTESKTNGTAKEVRQEEEEIKFEM